MKSFIHIGQIKQNRIQNTFGEQTNKPVVILYYHRKGKLKVKVKVRVKVTLWPTTSRSVSPGFKAYEGLTTGYLFLLIFTSIVLSIMGAPSDERSGLSFVLVIICPLLVNIYRFIIVRDIYPRDSL
jgi:hypothetical protein